MKGLELKKLRKRMGLSPEKLADLLNIEKIYIVQFENEEEIPIAVKRIINSILASEIIEEEKFNSLSKLKEIPIEPDLFNIKNQNKENKNQSIRYVFDVKSIRRNLNMNQIEFADFIGVQRETLINWELKNKIPPSQIKYFELLLKITLNNKTKDQFSFLQTDSNISIDTNENLHREIKHLKDYIKTLEELITDKNKIIYNYKNETTLLK